MKTNIYTTILVTLTFIIISGNLSASKIKFTEEAYIDDIPFNTEEVVNSIMTEKGMASFHFDDEAYINDIPFETESIVEELNNPNSIDFDDEAYVDDIPFSTASIACECVDSSSVYVGFEEESYIDDIPFNTEKIVKTYNYNQAVQHVFSFEDENYFDDIPFDTYIVANQKPSQASPVYYSVTVMPLDL